MEMWEMITRWWYDDFYQMYYWIKYILWDNNSYPENIDYFYYYSYKIKRTKLLKLIKYLPYIKWEDKLLFVWMDDNDSEDVFIYFESDERVKNLKNWKYWDTMKHNMNSFLNKNIIWYYSKNNLTFVPYRNNEVNNIIKKSSNWINDLI